MKPAQVQASDPLDPRPSEINADFAVPHTSRDQQEHRATFGVYRRAELRHKIRRWWLACIEEDILGEVCCHILGLQEAPRGLIQQAVWITETGGPINQSGKHANVS